MTANRKGILLMIAAVASFAVQDGFSRHLAGTYNTLMVVMVRYWCFAGFVTVLALRRPEGFRAAIRSRRLPAHVVRSLLLVAEICVIIYGYTLIGLIESHAVFTCYPLLVAALSGPILGEQVGWRRWSAIGVGFVGVLIILQPGFAVFSPWALVPLLSSFLFALYGLLTRYVARKDAASVSFFWTGTAGAVAMTPIGLWHWQAMTPADWVWMATLCCTGALGHWLLIRTYAVAEASAVQPFAYLQLVFVAVLGITLFGEALQTHVIVGAAIVVSAGVFTLWRQRLRAQISAPSTLP